MSTLLPQNIRLLSQDELKDVLLQWGYKKAHATTIYASIWHRFIPKIAALQNELPERLYHLLAQHYFIPETKIFTQQQSTDGTIKCSIQLHDNHLIESVLIPSEKRMTVCVSSQVGCSLSCTFCATGYMERKRNVTFDEIVDQVVLLNQLALKQYQRPVTNVVFMGMGEPLLNYQNVIEAVKKLKDQKGLSIAPKRITISTAGVAKMIKKLGDEGLKVNLALSLHAADEHKRNQIMPINESNNLATLIEALDYFGSRSKNPITLEYILLNGFNDSLADAQLLLDFAAQTPIHLINILEYNAIEHALFEKPDEAKMNAFVQYLLQRKANAHLRRSRGKDIDAACGQLANQEAQQ